MSRYNIKVYDIDVTKYNHGDIRIMGDLLKRIFIITNREPVSVSVLFIDDCDKHDNLSMDQSNIVNVGTKEGLDIYRLDLFGENIDLDIRILYLYSINLRVSVHFSGEGNGGSILKFGTIYEKIADEQRNDMKVEVYTKKIKCYGGKDNYLHYKGGVMNIRYTPQEILTDKELDEYKKYNRSEIKNGPNRIELFVTNENINFDEYIQEIF